MTNVLICLIDDNVSLAVGANAAQTAALFTQVRNRKCVGARDVEQTELGFEQRGKSKRFWIRLSRAIGSQEEAAVTRILGYIFVGT